MENFQLQDYGQSAHNQFKHDSDHPAINSPQDDQTNLNNSLDYYDESGNYRLETFENLGSLHYMNYLHSHDDML